MLYQLSYIRRGHHCSKSPVVAGNPVAGLDQESSSVVSGGRRSIRSTVSTVTEVHDALGLLYAKLGTVHCRNCGAEVRPADPEAVALAIDALPDRTRYLIAFPVEVSAESDSKALGDSLREDGFTRIRVDGEVLPLFVLDPALWGPAGPSRRAYLAASLRDLDARLRELGGRLEVVRGKPVNRVVKAAQAVGAERVHIAADYGPYGHQRDLDVEEALGAKGIELARTGSPGRIAPRSCSCTSAISQTGERLAVW